MRYRQVDITLGVNVEGPQQKVQIARSLNRKSTFQRLLLISQITYLIVYANRLLLLTTILPFHLE